MDEKRKKSTSLSITSPARLIQENPDNIKVRCSSTYTDYFVFSIKSNGKEIARLRIDDCLTEMINNNAIKWIEKICQANIIDINDPSVCGGSTILAQVLYNKQLHSMISFLCEQGAILTAQEVSEFYKEHKFSVRKSSNDSNTLVISTAIRGENYELTRLKSDKILEAAIDNRNADWIEFLIDNQYISIKPSPELVEDFKNGCWVSVVSKVPDEIKRIKAFEQQQTPDCRPYTCATFIRPGINIALFSNGCDSGAGFLIKQTGRVVDYWYSGLAPNGGRGEELTDGLLLETLKKRAKTEKDNQHFCDILESALFKQMDSSIESRWKNLGYRSDKYGALKRHTLFAWNEGLIRYRSIDVFGIHYNRDNKPLVISGGYKTDTSGKKAFILYQQFYENFGIKLPFYNYKDGILSKVEAPKEVVENGILLYRAANRQYAELAYQKDLSAAWNNIKKSLVYLPTTDQNYISANHLAGLILCRIATIYKDDKHLDLALKSFLKGKKYLEQAMEVSKNFENFNNKEIRQHLKSCIESIEICKNEVQTPSNRVSLKKMNA